jgi:hypothetical protein
MNTESDTKCCLSPHSYIYNSCILKVVEDELDQLEASTNQITDSIEDEVFYNPRGKNVGSLLGYIATLAIYKSDTN